VNLNRLAELLTGPGVRRSGLTNRRRARLVVTFAALAFLWCAICALLFQLVFSIPVGTLVSVMGALSFLGIPAILRIAPPIVAGNFLILAMFCFMGSICFVVGGWSAPLLLWYSVLPALAAMVGNSRWSVFWAVAALSHLFAVYIVHMLGYIPVRLSVVQNEMLGCVSIIGFMMVLVSLSYSYERFETQSLRRLRRINQELKGARDRALQASQAKTSFLANMSHEFRTPLNAILGYSELIVEEHEPDPKVCDDLNRIKTAGTHLLELVNGLLDLSKIESGQVEVDRSTFLLGPLIDELESTIQPQLKKRRNSFEIIGLSEPLKNLILNTDALKLKQCLINLLGNACKFTENGSITLEVIFIEPPQKTQRNQLIFKVRDTGIGMTEEQQGKVFAPFVQADTSTARKFGGTGLGLAICERFVSALQGSLSVTSTPGKGSTFTVAIPQILPTEIKKAV
jgi:signal transduction histidine kinase